MATVTIHPKALVFENGDRIEKRKGYKMKPSEEYEKLTIAIEALEFYATPAHFPKYEDKVRKQEFSVDFGERALEALKKIKGE